MHVTLKFNANLYLFLYRSEMVRGKGKKKIQGPFFIPKQGTNGLYKFFKDDNLRFYLHDVIGPTSVIKDGKMQYNPLVIYLMHLVSLIIVVNNLSRDSFFRF